ncbi:MAG: YIP1 family protein [Clostridia bacterium]|nr:YIP1 family protein [Clostridia bacterium]
MRCFKKIVSFLLLLAISFSVLTVSAATALDSPELSFDSYTYWQDYAGQEKKAVYCKPMYEPSFAMDYKYLGAAELIQINDVCTDKDGNVYILDGGAGIIYILDKNYKPVSKIEVIKSEQNEEYYFDNASGIFIKDDGTILIANTDYETVLACDRNGKYLYELILPDSNIIPEDFTYAPIKVAVDAKGNVYVLSQGSFYGALLYSPDNDFLGFFGANTVASTVGESLKALFTELFMTNEKKALSDSKLPYQFVDLCIDKENFVYTVTGVTDSTSIEVQKGQVKRFNPGGVSVLGKDDFNYADATVSKVLNVTKAQDLMGIAVDDNNFVYVVDSTYGRIFMYDRENQLLCVFGGGIGRGNSLGTFSLPSAIALNGDDVLVADGELNRVTVFKITEYGRLVKKADNTVISGYYDKCKEDWLQIMSLDKNNQVAYKSLAKIYLSEGNYDLALEYAETGYDKQTYSLAFKSVRREFLVKYFPVIFVLIIVLIIVLVVSVQRASKKEKNVIKNQKLRTMLNCLIHPFEYFDRVKYKDEGSVSGAFVLIAIFYCTTVLKTTAGGFLFTDYDPAEYNAFLKFIQTFGFVFLWTVSNWAVCTLFGGIGKLKEIFVVISYALMPLIIYNALFLGLSHFFVANEVGFLTVFNVVSLLYSGILITVGSLKIHDFSFGRFVGTALLSLFGMVVVVFLIFISATLVQQLGGFIVTVASELIYS